MPDPTTADPGNEGNKYRQIFRLREVHLLAAFLLVYVGVEVTIGGQYARHSHRVGLGDSLLAPCVLRPQVGPSRT